MSKTQWILIMAVMVSPLIVWLWLTIIHWGEDTPWINEEEKENEK